MIKTKKIRKIPSYLTATLIFLVGLSGVTPSLADEVKTSEQLNLELRSLEQFDDIAVIQRKYLMKTERFEFFGSAIASLNSQLFTIFGFSGSLGYHFSERLGVELSFLFSADSQKEITKGLQDEYFISTTDLVTPQTYLGLHLRWSPIYGKISLRERSINPFEVYFTFGGGITGTDDGQSAPTLHLGIGQFYPMSKNMTFRWGLGFNTFQATSKGSVQQDITAYTLFLSGGLSWYFPFTEER